MNRHWKTSLKNTSQRSWRIKHYRTLLEYIMGMNVVLKEEKGDEVVVVVEEGEGEFWCIRMVFTLRIGSN